MRISQQVLFIMLISGQVAVYADEEQKNEHVPQFRFEFDPAGSKLSKLYHHHADEAVPYPEFSSLSATDSILNGTLLNQYDATVYYPLGKQGITFDVGVNIKYLDGVKSQLEEGRHRVQNFSEAIPMIYATALFDLPFSGLSAGFEGSHYELDDTRAIDYKAKLSYEWGEGFGMQGGWQHQQYSLDSSDKAATDYENKGLFLDLFMKF